MHQSNEKSPDDILTFYGYAIPISSGGVLGKSCHKSTRGERNGEARLCDHTDPRETYFDPGLTHPSDWPCFKEASFVNLGWAGWRWNRHNREPAQVDANAQRPRSIFCPRDDSSARRSSMDILLLIHGLVLHPSLNFEVGI
jgi:hypothetical protein